MTNLSLESRFTDRTPMRRIPLTIGTSELCLRKLTDYDVAPIRAWFLDDSNRAAHAGRAIDPGAFLLDTFLLGPGSSFSLQYGIVVENGSRLIGLAGIYAIDWTKETAEIGLMIGDMRYRGHGYGTKILHLLTEMAAHDLRIRMIFAQVLPGNIAASRCFQKSGFHPAGEGMWARRMDATG